MSRARRRRLYRQRRRARIAEPGVWQRYYDAHAPAIAVDQAVALASTGFWQRPAP